MVVEEDCRKGCRRLDSRCVRQCHARNRMNGMTIEKTSGVMALGKKEVWVAVIHVPVVGWVGQVFGA